MKIGISIDTRHIGAFLIGSDGGGYTPSEVIEDTGFDDPSKWTTTPAASWTVASSVATCNTTGAIYCEGFTREAFTYDIEITIDAGAVFTGRGLVLRASYAQELEIKTEGTHNFTMAAEGTNAYIIMEAVDEAGTPSLVGNVSHLSVIG